MPLKISRILHAGYVFECDDIQIAFDPIFENPFSQNCFAFPDVHFDLDKIKKLKFAGVFISHYHDDHCSLESLSLLDRATPVYIYCVYTEMAKMIKELGFTHVHQLEIGVSVVVGPFEIIPRRALDADVDSIFHIKAAGLNVLNVVDSWIDFSTLNALSQYTPWDMVLWPFQTMREIEVLAPSRSAAGSNELPPEWIEQLKALNPKYIVPSSCQFIQESWSWYNHALFPVSYSQFAKEVQTALPGSHIKRLNPGVSVVLDQNTLSDSPALNWVLPVGDPNVDYEYRPDIKPPGTAEVALRFPPLSAEQTKRVVDYCRVGLIVKYRAMGPSADRYFSKPRNWRLSVYDHIGQVTQFCYRLNAACVEIVSDFNEPISWSTEIPVFKLYSALENGEALTSLYIRINDVVFTPEIENEMASVDIIEDPLIRCLFNGVFGAYQRAQLRRLTTFQCKL